MAMMGSRIIPGVRYRDAHAAMDWLVRVFGMTKHAVYEGDGVVHHAQMTYEGGMLMLGSATKDGPYAAMFTQPDQTGGVETAGMCLIVDDCDAAYARAKAEGAEIFEELNEPPHGGKAFACKDPEGFVWWVGSYNPWKSNE